MNEELYKALGDANLVRAAEIMSAGADINERDKHGETILDQIVLDFDDIPQRRSVIRFMLDHGADPNAEHEVGESLYSYAEFDYRFETYDMHLPEEPTEADKASEDAWLQFLDRLAIQHGVRRPDYLILLRQRGALTSSERQPNATGNA